MENLKTFEEFSNESIDLNEGIYSKTSRKFDLETALDKCGKINSVIRNTRGLGFCQVNRVDGDKNAFLIIKADKENKYEIEDILSESEDVNEANKDFRPESVRTREKITNLYTKSNDAVTKARELDNEGEMLKSRIQFLTSESLRLKARAAELDWRIKQLKEKL